MEKFNDRKFALLLYPDDSTHMQALEKIKQSYDCAYILHDKDMYLEDTEEHAKGDCKKAHYHVIIRVGNNARWSTAVCKELGIEHNYIEQIKNLDRMLMYLIHYNDCDKYQYDIKEVKGNLATRLKMLVNKDDKTEGEKVNEILDFINEQEDVLTVTKFARWCSTSGYWDVFRRSGAIILKCIEEHNEDIYRRMATPKRTSKTKKGDA